MTGDGFGIILLALLVLGLTLVILLREREARQNKALILSESERMQKELEAQLLVMQLELGKALTKPLIEYITSASASFAEFGSAMAAMAQALSEEQESIKRSISVMAAMVDRDRKQA